jgi:hypothetical protein
MLCLSAAGQSGGFAAPSQQATATPATTVIHDLDTSVPANQRLLRSDDYNGVGEATYTTTCSGTAQCQGVNSYVSLNGHGWQLDLFSQSTRTIWLTLSKPVPGSPPAPAPDGYYWASVEAYGRCWDLNNQEIPIISIPVGTSNNRCTLASDFQFGRTKYKFVMGQPSITGTSTGWASISCNTGNGGVCTSWTIVPYMGGANATVSNLYEFTNHGLLYIGSYYNTYRIDVTTP